MLKKILLLSLALVCLPGCIAAIGAGAATGGLIAYDRRNVHTILDDQYIEQQINIKLSINKELQKSSHITVATFNHIVLLVGQAPTEEMRAHALKLVQSVPTIKRIYNEITLSGSTSPLTQSSDGWITTKIKTKLIACAFLQATQIKVVTENGVVYLMGVVSHKQAELAVNIAREISGVQRVVKIFEYQK